MSGSRIPLRPRVCGCGSGLVELALRYSICIEMFACSRPSEAYMRYAWIRLSGAPVLRGPHATGRRCLSASHSEEHIFLDFARLLGLAYDSHPRLLYLGASPSG